jgi:hypothetical protein
LLADELSSSAGEANVFAYTFATPNNTKTPHAYRTNIFNFCFNDDFVPQVPLDAGHKWKYGKHGITKTITAGALYNNNTVKNTAFKNDMDTFLGGAAVFNLSGTTTLLNHIASKWDNVQEYYNNSCYTGTTVLGTATPANLIDAANPLNYMTLHDFFHDELAKAAMGCVYESGLVAAKALNYYFGPISTFFIAGSDLPKMQNYIYNNHHEFTYYTAVKYGLFN